jgi:predicted KAP-like P-loop ATPase
VEFRYLPDLHVQSEKDDLLNFSPVAHRIVAAIKNSVPPFTWGIYGDWGSGKTSLMNLMRMEMESDLKKKKSQGPVLIPIWFDAWRYENEVNIIYPLFDAIRRDFTKRFPIDSDNQSFLQSFKRVATTSLLGLTDLALRAATKAAFGDALKLKDVKESFDMVEAEADLETVFSKWTDQVTEVRDAFENFVEEYIKVVREQNSVTASREVYLAVFIDDLDRCLPDVAIEILERIKNHLISKRCVFVLGINRNVVYQSIKKKYGDLQIDGRQHLEKIIQHSIGVPRPTKEAIINFGIERLKALVVATKQPLDSYFEAFSKTLNDSYFTNPRKIKRIMNTYLNFVFNHIQVHKDINEFNLPTVVRLIILREYHQDFYQLFREEGFDPFKLIAARSTDSTQKFSEQYAKRWEYLIPQLDRMKDLGNISPGNEKSLNDYRDAIDELFGLED